MESCIYEGRIRHRRWSPQPHQFAYPLFFVYLDLDEVPAILAGADGWRAEGPDWSAHSRMPYLAKLDRRDHLGPSHVPLAQSVRELVERSLHRKVCGPIRLLTHLRYLGYGFNPVSVFYCFDNDSKALEAIVAEVNNTPWLEQHPYVLDARNSTHHSVYSSDCPGDNDVPSPCKRYQFHFSKKFHVSPFLGMNQQYDWRFGLPGPKLWIHMENWEAGERVFDATLHLRRRPINRWMRWRCLLRFPWLGVQITAAIHWQAIRLWMKGCCAYPHPEAETTSMSQRETRDS